MIGGQGRFESRENVDLALAADFEDCAAAVADVEISVGIEDHAGGDTHAFYVYGKVSGGGHLIDHAVVAAGGVEDAFGVEGQAGGVHEVSDQGLSAMVRVDFIDGNGGFLAGRSAEGRVDISSAVY